MYDCSMKQAQKAASKKSSLQNQTWGFTSSRKTLIWLAVAAVLVLASIGWFVFEQLAIHNDRLRFEDASNVKTAVVNRLATYLGNNVVSTREQDECFNTEQGPYDNGRLWCQVATVIRLKADVDYNLLGMQLSTVAQQDGEVANSSGAGSTERFWLTLKSMDCGIVMTTSRGVQYGSITKDVLSPIDKPAIAIACADRAMASYYPYTPLR